MYSCICSYVCVCISFFHCAGLIVLTYTHACAPLPLTFLHLTCTQANELRWELEKARRAQMRATMKRKR